MTPGFYEPISNQFAIANQADNASNSTHRRFILLDRDGTINEERNYLSDPSKVQLIAGAAAALRILQDAGLGLVVVTNQAGVGRGLFDLPSLERVNRRICQLLASEGVYFDGIYFCPHAPQDKCSCRKPQTGLVRQAAKKFGFDPTKAIVVGDRDSDIGLGQNVGATTFLVSTGYGAQTISEGVTKPDYLAEDLFEAAQMIKFLTSDSQNSDTPDNNV